MEKFKINPKVIDQAQGLREKEDNIVPNSRQTRNLEHASKRPTDQAQGLRELAAKEKQENL